MLSALSKTLFVIAIVIGSLWVAWMATDNGPPFQYLPEEQGSRVVPNPVKQEGAVKTEWLLTSVSKDCPRQIERLYYDRDTGELVTTQDATPLQTTIRKSSTQLSRSFDLPPGLPPRVGYRARACFQCNFLQRLFPICFLSPQLSINIIP